MALGYTDPKTGTFTKGSSVQLRNIMRVSDDEATRKACYEVRSGRFAHELAAQARQEDSVRLCRLPSSESRPPGRVWLHGLTGCA
jgi:hypothetical protein